MEKVTSEATLGKAALTMGPDSIEAEVRGRIRGWIEELVEAELTTVLGAEVSARPGGCAKGIGMAIGSARRVPVLAPRRFSCRGPVLGAGRPDAGVAKCRGPAVSAAHRARLLGVYLSGTNSRRIRSALAPLLKGAPLSKHAVSRLTAVSPTILQPGAAALWRPSRFGICFSTAGIRRCGWGNNACACRCW
jgi:hypothetical protein